MQPYAVNPSSASASPASALIGVGAGGAALCTLGALANLLVRSALPKYAIALGGIGLLVGAIGLFQRTKSPLWLLCVLAFVVQVLLDGLRVVAGPVMYPLLAMTGLQDALAFGFVGVVLLVRRADGHPAVGAAAGIVILVEAAMALLMAAGMAAGGLGLLSSAFLTLWRVLIFLASAGLAGFFVTAFLGHGPSPAPAGMPPAGWPPHPGPGRA